MINEIPELLKEDTKFSIFFTPKIPETFNLKLVYPSMVYTKNQLKELLKAQGIL